MKGSLLNWSAPEAETNKVLSMPSVSQPADGMAEHQENASATATFVLGADILFFRDYHTSLIEFLKNQLKQPHDYCALVQPDRDRTLTQFVEKLGSREGPAPQDLYEPGLVLLGLLPFLK